MKFSSILKLPRFSKGKSFREQVTADVLNQISIAIESNQILPGNGYSITKTPKGTSLTVDSPRAYRPELWNVDFTNLLLDPFAIAAQILDNAVLDFENAVPNESQFSSVFDSVLAGVDVSSDPSASSIAGSIEALFNALENEALSLISQVDTLVNDNSTIASTLKDHFEGKQRYPKDGDRIYTDELGIVYEVYMQRNVDGSPFPDGNTIFRVPFEIVLGADEDVSPPKTFVAITLFPAPSIGELLSAVFGVVISLIKKTISNVASALALSVRSSLVEGLLDLLDLLTNAINAVGALIPDISPLLAAISALEDDVQDLTSDINALETALSPLQTTINNAVDISLIQSDGKEITAKVLNGTVGSELRTEITWIDSSTGIGQKAKTIIWDHVSPNVQDIDWRQVNYIHPDGRKFQMHCLVQINNSEPIEQPPHFTLSDVEICNNGTAETKRILLDDTGA